MLETSNGRGQMALDGMGVVGYRLHLPAFLRSAFTRTAIWRSAYCHDFHARRTMRYCTYLATYKAGCPSNFKPYITTTFRILLQLF
jgi:hypothetical protein